MRRRLSLAYFGLALLFLIWVGVRVRSSSDVINGIRHGTEIPRPFFDLQDPDNVITALLPAGETAGLRKGDVLLGFNGRPYTGLSDIMHPMRTLHVGDRVSIEVQRDAVIKTAAALPPLKDRPIQTRELIVSVADDLMMPVICGLLGFWVVAVRIRDPHAWLLLFLLLGFGQQSGTGAMTLYSHDDWFQPITIAFHQSLANGWPIAMMLFGIYFPERLIYDRRWPWAKWLLLGPLLVHLAMNVMIKVLQPHHTAWALMIDRPLQPLDRPLFAMGLIAIGLFFFGTGTKAGMSKKPDARRRLSLMLWGAAVSLTPVFLVVLKDFILNQPRFENTPQWLMLLVLGALFFFPVVLAYVIVVQRAMDVRVVLRQSVQYLLASNSVFVLQIGLIFLVILIVTSIASDSNSGMVRVAVIAVGLLQIIFIQKRVERLRVWVDRRFFREAYTAELVLGDLADKVRTIVKTEPLLETVARHIVESLHVTRVVLLLEQTGGFQPAYALGYPAQPWASIPQNGVTAALLRREQHASVYSDDKESWIYRPDVSEDERHALQTLDSQLLLPLSLNQKLLGILILGPKQSEAPFSRNDLRLLQSVATQTGFALENSRLTEAVASEVAQRERMNRELEIAREVQERLFPQELPEFSALDYAGSCRPALGVGGDYYDFIRLSEHELGIAIGDVSGKGIPAALLMASLRASLRGQTIRHETDLAQLMANVNTLVYESSTSNRYATFFYAQYDTVSRRLSYVNAGHNPPLIFRKGLEVIKLETGGPVVGLLPSFPYAQATIELHPGDLLVAFTDGISEAMNVKDEEWGEDKLIEFVEKAANLPAEELMRQIVRAADAFVGGANQHDDMTIIVMRIRG